MIILGILRTSNISRLMASRKRKTRPISPSNEIPFLICDNCARVYRRSTNHHRECINQSVISFVY